MTQNKLIEQIVEVLKKQVEQYGEPVLTSNKFYEQASTEIASLQLDQADAIHERELVIAAFSELRKAFEGREWIMEGRGAYKFNDDKYKEEVRYLYNDCEKIIAKAFAAIKSKSFEYKDAIQKPLLAEIDNLKQQLSLHPLTKLREEVERLRDSILPERDSFIQQCQYDSAAVIQNAINAYNQVLSLLPQENDGWISVEDRLPEDGSWVLAWSTEGKSTGRHIAWYSNKQWSTRADTGLRSVTHFMPLPSPPKSK